MTSASKKIRPAAIHQDEMRITPKVSKAKAERPLILAIDIGTSVVRTMVFDRLGRAIEGLESRRSHKIETQPQGTSEANPDLLLRLVWDCIDQTVAEAAPFAREIKGVVSCTFVGNLMGIDEKGRPLTPLVTYADTRSDDEAERLRSRLDEVQVHNRTGCRLHPSYWPSLLLWFAKNKPDLFGKVRQWISLGAYLQGKLFGQRSMTFSVASWTGLLNRHRLVWDEGLLAHLPITEQQLPPLSDFNVPCEGLSKRYARRWPVLSRIPWFPALGDGAAANIGSGCFSPHRVALTVGSTTALRSVTDKPVSHLPKGLWCYRVDRKRQLLGGALSEGGSVYSWLRSVLKLGDERVVEKHLSASLPDGHGLTVLPFWAGERSPGWAGYARAALCGLSLATTPQDILRAVLEAIAYRIGLVFELLGPLLPPSPEVVASGGALTHSSQWLRIITDVLGLPVSPSRVEEPSARGVSLLGLEALGFLRDLKDVPDFIGPPFRPNAAWHGRYKEAAKRQKELYRKLIGKDPSSIGIHRGGQL